VRFLAGVLRRTAAVGAALACAVALAGTAGASSQQLERLESATAIKASLPSKALQSELHFAVYLPPGYASSGTRRYPVVYFLHGLPAGPTAYLSLAWVDLALEETGRQAILVVPQGSRTENGDPEYQNWGAGGDWETALSVELPAWIDRNYRTIANRSGRALVGVSAGGYGASIIGIHHPNTFSVIESWSGYFRPTDPTGEKTLELGSSAADTDASVLRLAPTLAKQFAAHPTFFAFYVGKDDPTFVPDNRALDAALTAAGVPHTFELYAGAHTTALWQTHATEWLALALAHLPPSSG